MLCPNCGYKSDDPEMLHCMKCGTRMVTDAITVERASKKCPHCRMWVPEGEEVCPQCGKKVGMIPELKISPPGPVTGFFRQRASLVGAVLGLMLTVIVIYALYQIARPDTFVQKMFLPGGVLSTVPWTITYFFLWSVCELLIRAFNLTGQRRAMNSRQAADVKRRLKEGDIAGVVNVLESVTKTSSFYNRLQRALYLWTITGQRDSVEDELRRQAELDTETTIGGYTAIRTFIWAMPVIGFIGTVIGISLAVGDFSSFLGGEIENIDVVKAQLMDVTDGLSFAFLTTLHGLLGALFVMLPASALQKAEEDFCIELDSVTRDVILPNLGPSDTREDKPEVSADIFKQLSETLKVSLPELSELKESIGDYTKALLDNFTEAASAFNREILKQHEEGYREITKGILRGLEKGSEELGSRMDRQITDTGERNISKVNEVGNRNVERMNKALGDIGSKISELGKELTDGAQDAGKDGDDSA